MILGVYCVICWKAGWTKAPKDESFCVIVATNYEVEEVELMEEGIEVVWMEEVRSCKSKRRSNVKSVSNWDLQTSAR